MDQVLLTLSGYLLSVLMYFAGVQRGKRYREEDRQSSATIERQRRIDRVVDDYLKLHRSGQSSGLRGFLAAGASSLSSAEEISQAVDAIWSQTGKSPIPSDINLSTEKDIAEFFAEVSLSDWPSSYDRARKRWERPA